MQKLQREMRALEREEKKMERRGYAREDNQKDMESTAKGEAPVVAAMKEDEFCE